jgi:hypothetical protein
MKSAITRVPCTHCRVSVHVGIDHLCPICKRWPCPIEDIPLMDDELDTMVDEATGTDAIRAAREIRRLRAMLEQIAAMPEAWYAMTQESVKKVAGLL